MSYRLDGYVPYTSERDRGPRGRPARHRQPVPLLEATESGGREVRIILNWGSRPDQVRDADSHVACPCGGPGRHVYYQNRTHEAAEHKVELDVDDTDWGGPETITLTRPVPGTYLYWVHDYSGPPATLGASDVVVRVVIGAEEAGEFRVFKGVTKRAWRPVQGHRGRAATAGRRSCGSPRTRSRRPPTSPFPRTFSRPARSPHHRRRPRPTPATRSTFPVPILFLLVFVVFVLIVKARRRRRG